MTIWPPKRSALKRPVYHSLAEAIVAAIEGGALKTGDRLPTHRELAYNLGVSVQTVGRAYEDLTRRGVIAGIVGRGTFVRGTDTDSRTPFVADNQQDSLIDCSILKPVCNDIHVEEMQAALATLSDGLRGSVVTSFRPATAIQAYRGPILTWLQSCGLDVPGDNMIITNGNTSAMTMALMTVAKSGDLVATEGIGHHTLKALAGYLGLKLVGLRTDREGIVPAEFQRACERPPLRALYVMPSGLNPTAAMMSLKRRKELARLAARFDVQIIENDAWGPCSLTVRPQSQAWRRAARSTSLDLRSV